MVEIYMDSTNKNNHAGIKKLEAASRAEELLGIINRYRVELQMKESVYTSEVLFFLREFEKELFKEYEKEFNDGELSRAREEYLLRFHKKPFMNWTVEEIRQKMEEGKAEELKEDTLVHKKKIQWTRKTTK